MELPSHPHTLLFCSSLDQFNYTKKMAKGQNQNGNKKQEEQKKEQQKKITEVVVKVYMHCEACKTKVSKCLRALDGVEEVIAEVENQKVVIKGKDLNPKEILDGIKKKYSKNVELISPKDLPESTKQDKPEPKKEEIQIKTVELKMNMHCEGCEKDIKQSIGRMEGVMSVETNRESSKVIVKGVVDAPKLVESIRKKMGKNAEMVKKKEEKERQGKGKGGEQEKEAAKKKEGEEAENFVFKYPPQYSLVHIYPDQTFSDDNVFSCSIM